MFRVNARTVLELGSELISSDIIAFYELIKNAFDAGSKTGAEIHFHITLRRNEYLRARDRAEELRREKLSVAEANKVLRGMIEQLVGNISASGAGAEHFKRAIAQSRSIKEFEECLDECYRRYNTITVSDAGSGMSLPELGTNFLTLGTPARKHQADDILGRGGSKLPLGEKGIGRLSAMRLGELLSVETATAEDSHLSILEIDWRAFEDPDKTIEEVRVTPHRGPEKVTAEWHGTRLSISGLREDWTERRVRELAESDFARLTDPFPDQKLRPRIALHWNGERIAIPHLERALIDNAHATLKGRYSVANDGPALLLNMTATKLGAFEHPVRTESLRLAGPNLESLLGGTEELIPQRALRSVGEFDFEIYWFNRRVLTGIDEIGNQKAVREAVKRWSSIMLFRDGFRVFPYGEGKDDWLSLDAVALGRTGYVLNKSQFIGHVRISRSKNPELVDQTNREGLRDTPESQVFKEILHDAVADRLWSFFRSVDQEYRVRMDNLDEVKGQVSALEVRAKAALGKLRQNVPPGDRELVADLESVLLELHELSVKVQRKAQQLEADSRQLVHIAGVGLLVEMIAHELTRATEGTLASLEGLRGKDNELPQEVRARLETLRAEVKSVSKRLRVLDEASVSGRQRAETFDLLRLLADFKDSHEALLNRHNIEMRISGPTERLSVKLVRGLLVQILENLLSNAVYWMKLRASRDATYSPAINLRVGVDPLTIHFSDNGSGIEPDHREHVFQPFWSLKERTKRRGLGLFIARSNAQDLKGSLSLSDKPDKETGRLHEFILTLPNTEVAL